MIPFGMEARMVSLLRSKRWVLGVVLLALSAHAAHSQAPTPEPPPAAQASANFDPLAATEAYLAKLSPEERARSDAYFEGGYWLQLWGFLYGLGVALLLLATRLSARMRDLARRISRRGPLQTILYWVQYLLVTTLLGFPLAVYQGYFREHQYGLATQTFGPWLVDQLKGLAVGLVMGALLLVPLYGVIRRLPRSWWIWGAAVMIVFLMFGALITPVYINPIFNKYTPLADPEVRDPILLLARANGIPAREVWEMDASRQSKRISANVSGFLGTERITLNDNLLQRCSLPEIEAVMGHEMGHYVLNHVYELILELGLVIVAGFAFLRWGFAWAERRWGARWGISGIGDLAALPLVVAVFSVFLFLMTPVVNTVIRINEVEADIFGLNASREPDGFAEVSLKLGEYRKLAPGPLEEAIFFDHPSGRNRILMAMRWKAEHLPPRGD
ncbi:MAG TPA: M48 family metallopeptidase [Thermoanaerobaculia bacterium]|nr:M48 family metallopeptidase [Thermoanaerobaculia bacterium]